MNIRKIKRNPVVKFIGGLDRLAGKIVRYGVKETGKTLVRGFKRVTRSGKRVAVKSHYRHGVYKTKPRKAKRVIIADRKRYSRLI